MDEYDAKYPQLKRNSVVCLIQSLESFVRCMVQNKKYNHSTHFKIVEKLGGSHWIYDEELNFLFDNGLERDVLLFKLHQKNYEKPEAKTQKGI